MSAINPHIKGYSVLTHIRSKFPVGEVRYIKVFKDEYICEYHDYPTRDWMPLRGMISQLHLMKGTEW